MTVAPVPLLAANLDWLEGLFVVVMVLFWIGSQIVAVFRRPAPRQPPVERRPPPAAPPAGADDPRDALARQIEDFLRDRAAGGRPQPPRDPRGPVATPAELRRRIEATQPRPQQSPKPQRPQPIAPAATAAPQPPAAGRQMGGLGGHSGDIARHVREAFTPHVAAAASSAARPTPSAARPAVAAPAPAARAADIIALLRQPAVLRQLVVAREILDRPEHRW